MKVYGRGNVLRAVVCGRSKAEREGERERD